MGDLSEKYGKTNPLCAVFRVLSPEGVLIIIRIMILVRFILIRNKREKYSLLITRSGVGFRIMPEEVVSEIGTQKYKST